MKKTLSTVRDVRFFTFTLEDYNEIKKLVEGNEEFHDCKVDFIEYDGKSHAHITVSDAQQHFQFIFDEVSSFKLSTDPEVVYIDEILLSNEDNIIHTSFVGADIELTAKKLVVETTIREGNQNILDEIF